MECKKGKSGREKHSNEELLHWRTRIKAQSQEKAHAKRDTERKKRARAFRKPQEIRGKFRTRAMQ
jgi:hypothetical protein